VLGRLHSPLRRAFSGLSPVVGIYFARNVMCVSRLVRCKEVAFAAAGAWEDVIGAVHAGCIAVADSSDRWWI